MNGMNTFAGVDLDALYSSLVSCFVTMFVGYACVKSQLIAANESRALKVISKLFSLL